MKTETDTEEAVVRRPTLTPKQVTRILLNPTTTGIGPFPRKVTDDAWLHSACKLMAKLGRRRYLEGVLKVMREDVGEAFQAHVKNTVQVIGELVTEAEWLLSWDPDTIDGMTGWKVRRLAWLARVKGDVSVPETVAPVVDTLSTLNTVPTEGAQ